MLRHTICQVVTTGERINCCECLHALHSIQCLQAGLHVLCEKPLCIKTEDGLAMIEAAKSANKKLFVVKSTRFNPVVAQLKK